MYVFCLFLCVFCLFIFFIFVCLCLSVFCFDFFFVLFFLSFFLLGSRLINVNMIFCFSFYCFFFVFGLSKSIFFLFYFILITNSLFFTWVYYWPRFDDFCLCCNFHFRSIIFIWFLFDFHKTNFDSPWYRFPLNKIPLDSDTQSLVSHLTQLSFKFQLSTTVVWTNFPKITILTNRMILILNLNLNSNAPFFPLFISTFSSISKYYPVSMYYANLLVKK